MIEERTLQEWCEELKQYHIQLIQESIKLRHNPVEMSKYRNENYADRLEEIMLEAKTVYYDTDSTIMSDNTYDRFETWLKILRPDSHLLEKVGYELDK